ncbi:hypothetical protein, partial [Acanthopleuribacter pedis]
MAEIRHGVAVPTVCTPASHPFRPGFWGASGARRRPIPFDPVFGARLVHAAGPSLPSHFLGRAWCTPPAHPFR